MRLNLFKGLIFLFSLFSFNSFGQSFPDNPTEIEVVFLNPTGVNLCRGGNEFTLQIKNPSKNNAIDAGVLINYTLPSGMELEGLVSGAATTGGKGDSPNFTLINSIPAGGTETISFTTSVKCETFQFVENNSLSGLANGISVDYSIGGNVSNIVRNASQLSNYNFTFTRPVITLPAINMLGNVNHPQLYTTPNEPLTQRVQVNLEGNGENLESFFVEIDLPANINALTDNVVCGITSNTSQSPSPGSVNVIEDNGILRIELNSVDFGKTGGFQAGVDEFVIDLCYTSDCSVGDPQIINYNTAVACFGDPCAITYSEGSFAQIPVFAGLNTNCTFGGDGNFCGTPSTMTYTITNNGNGPSFATNLRLGFPAGIMTFSNFTVNGQPAPGLDGLFASSGGVVNRLLSDFVQLSDANGDGLFGEVLVGETYTIECEIAHEIGASDCDDQFTATVNPVISYRRHECDRVVWGRDFRRTLSWNHSSELEVAGSSGCSELSIRDNDQADQTVRFCSRIRYQDSFGEILNDEFTFFANAAIPCGYELTDGAVVTLDVETPLSVNQSTNIPLNVLSTGTDSWRFETNQFFDITAAAPVRSTNVCFNIPLTVNCDDDCLMQPCGGNCREGKDNCPSDQIQTGGSLSIEAFAIPQECPTTRLGLGCEAALLTPPCDALNCPAGGLADVITDNFELNRATFGWIPGTNNQQRYTYQQVLDETIPQEVNLQGAYACDDVVARFNGHIRCGSTNGIMATFQYTIPSSYGQDFFEYIQADFIVNGVSIPATVHTNSLSFGIATHTIRLDNHVLNDGDIVEANITLKVNDDINEHNAPNNFPGVWELRQFQGQLRTIEDASRCPLCSVFEIYSIDSRESCSDAWLSCGRRGQFFHQFDYWGGRGDDFPIEVRPFIDITSYSVEILNPALIDELGIPDVNPIRFWRHGSTLQNMDLNVSGSEYIANNINQITLQDKVRRSTRCAFYMLMQPSCGFETTNPLFHSVIGIQRNFYAQNTGCDEQIESICDLDVTFSNSALTEYNPLERKKYATSNQVSFAGEVSSPSGSILQPWMRITFPEDLIKVTNGANRPYNLNGALGATYNDDGSQLFLALSAISSVLPMIGELDVELVDCANDREVEIIIETGWSCSPINQNPFDSNNQDEFCSSNKEILLLDLLKTNVELNVFPYFKQSETQEFCEELCFMTQTFNDERGNLFNPFLNFDVPDGMDITSLKYRHPITSDQIIPGNIMPSAFDLTGFVSANHNLLNDNAPWSMLHSDGSPLDFLSGTLSNPDNNLNTLDNYYQAEVCFLPTCYYNFAHDIVIQTGGQNACGQDVNQDFKIKPRFKGVEGLENYNPQLTFTSTPGNGCGIHNVTLTYVNDVDVSNLIKAGDQLIIRSSNGGKILSEPLEGAVGTYTYDLGITKAQGCQDIWFEAEIFIDVDVECKGQPCDDADFREITDRFEIPFKEGEVIMAFDLIDDACEYNTSNARLTLTNTGEIDLTDVEVFIYCDENQDGSIKNDKAITSVTIPLVQADQAPWSFIDNHFHNGRFGMTSVNKHNLKVGDVVYINQDPGFKHAGYNGQHTIQNVLSEYIVITDQAWLGNSPANGGLVYAGSTVTQTFDIPDLRSCGSGQIIASLFPEQICNCGPPLYDVDNYKCCDQLDISMVGTFNCQGILTVNFLGTDLGNIPVPQNLIISGLGTFPINDFSIPFTVDADPEKVQEFQLTMDIPRDCSLPQNISDLVTWTPLPLRIMGFPSVEPCDLSTGAWSILPIHKKTFPFTPLKLTNIVWTFDTDGKDVEKQGGLFSKYTFGESGTYKTCVSAEDELGCKYNVCRKDKYPEPFPSMTIVPTEPEKCGEEWIFTIESKDSPINLTWKISNEDGSIVYENRFVPGIVLKQNFTLPSSGKFIVSASGFARTGECLINDDIEIVIGDCCPDPINVKANIECDGTVNVDIEGYILPTHEVTIKWGDGTSTTGLGVSNFTKQFSCEWFGTFRIEVEVRRGPNCPVIKDWDQIEWQSTGNIVVQKALVDYCNYALVTFTSINNGGIQLSDFSWTPNISKGGKVLNDNSNQVTYDYGVAGNYTMNVCAADQDGCVYGENIPVKIDNPVPVMELKITNGNCLDPWRFDLISDDGIKDIEWFLTHPDNTVESPIGDLTSWTRESLSPGVYTISASADSRGAGVCPVNSTLETFTVLPECCDNFENIIIGEFTDCFGGFKLTINGLLWDNHNITIDWDDSDNPGATTVSAGTQNEFVHAYKNPLSHSVTVKIDRGPDCPPKELKETFTYTPPTFSSIGNAHTCKPHIKTISLHNLPAGISESDITWSSDGQLIETKNNGHVGVIDFGGMGSFNTTITAISPDGCKYVEDRKDDINEDLPSGKISQIKGDCEKNTPWVFTVVSDDGPSNINWTINRNGQPYPISPNKGKSISEVFNISGSYNVCFEAGTRSGASCPIDDCVPVLVNCCKTKGTFDVDADEFCADEPNGNVVKIQNVTKSPNLPGTKQTLMWVDQNYNQLSTGFSYVPSQMTVPTEPGKYFLELKTDFEGCIDKDHVEINVKCCYTSLDFDIPKQEYCTFGENKWPGYVTISNMTSAPSGGWTNVTMEISKGGQVIIPARNVNSFSTMDFYMNGDVGTYTATMKVKAGNCKDVKHKKFEIKECPCTNKIEISTKISCQAGATVTVSGDYDNYNDRFDIEWGDGTSSLGLHSWQLTHQYPLGDANYCIKATLIDPNCPASTKDCFDFKVNSITVVPNQKGCNDEEVTFTINEAANLHAIGWFIDGQPRDIGASKTLTETFPAAGVYTVSVKATDLISGCPVAGKTIVTVGDQTCDPNLDANAVQTNYNSVAGKYTVDMTSSVGDVDYYYYSTEGVNGPWKVSKNGVFDVGDRCGGEVCFKIGNSVCKEPLAPFKDMCESPIKCITLTPQN